MSEQLDKLLAAIGKPKRLLVVTHDNPDPDAIASACTLARLAQVRLEVPSRICFEGITGRAENRTLARALGLKRLSARRVNWSKWPRMALVDSQPGTGNNAFPARRVPDVVLDHHPLRRRTRGRFVDVRTQYGACATMLAEYLHEANVGVSPSLAAAICYAVASETRDLSHQASPADVDAYMRLYTIADKRLLSRIRHPRLKHGYFATMARGLASAFTYANIIGAHLGTVDHPDSVSLMADLLLQHERMGWSIVTGQYKGDLYVSIRGTRHTAHAGRLLRRLLGRKGRAGGHEAIGGGRCSLDGMDAAAIDDLKRDLVMRFVAKVRRRSEVELKPLVALEDFPVVARSTGDAYDAETEEEE